MGLILIWSKSIDERLSESLPSTSCWFAYPGNHPFSCELNHGASCIEVTIEYLSGRSLLSIPEVNATQYIAQHTRQQSLQRIAGVDTSWFIQWVKFANQTMCVQHDPCLSQGDHADKPNHSMRSFPMIQVLTRSQYSATVHHEHSQESYTKY